MRDEFGYTFIHPFDNENVIAGQGTIGLEILHDLDDVDVIVVPIGGGGLISGVALAAKKLKPSVKVYGVQACGAPSMFNSLRDGKIECLEKVSTIADGIAVKQPGENTFEICKTYVDEVVTVKEDEISSAILALIEQQKMIAEGAGAVSVAAVMFDKIPNLAGKKVVCVVSGGNIDVTILSRVIKRGLLTSGRSCNLCIELLDKPGQLQQVSEIIAGCGGNSIDSAKASDADSQEKTEQAADAPEGASAAPITADKVADGTYPITVDSSSNMFRIVDAQLIVENGSMHCVMTLSGTGYGKLFMGTGEEAAAASEADFIPYVENAEGKYTYDVPVDALDEDTACAAWSIRRERWYDRTLVFESAGVDLRADALK